MERRRDGLQRALIRTLPLDRRMTRIEPTAMPSKAPNKLIEVALPLDDINAAAARRVSAGRAVRPNPLKKVIVPGYKLKMGRWTSQRGRG